jgi:RNA polymerase sigma factor (sigma-70 family)
MHSDDPITHWIQGIKAGDNDAANLLWERYSRDLLEIARRRMASHRRASDEEDAVLSAFHSLCQRAQQGAFTNIKDRDDLWRMLVTITHRKALQAVRRETADKRGGQNTAAADGDACVSIPGRDPTPELAAMMEESVAEFLALLDDDELRRIALLKLEQYTDAEIAAGIGKSVATIERRLRLIRSIWREHYPEKAT